jgi:hypothetical protein
MLQTCCRASEAGGKANHDTNNDRVRRSPVHLLNVCPIGCDYIRSLLDGMGTMTEINRSEVNRALAKAIAYKQCGKDVDAALWAVKLVELLECAEIIKDHRRGWINPKAA